MRITTDPATTLTAAGLLAIPLARPEKLFSGDEAADRKLYRTLAMEFHPDRHPAYGEAFKHLAALVAARDGQLDDGTWCGAGRQTLALGGGKRLNVRYLRRYPFELGTLLIGRRSFAWLVRGEHRALYEQGVRTLKRLRYADDRMRNEMARVLPRIELEAETSEGFVLVMSRPPDVVRMRDVLDHLGGRMEPRHVAWILGTLHNMGAYLHWAGLTHNAIGLDSWFISPRDHTGLLLGGWWYARPAGEAMTYLPAASAGVWRTILPPQLAAARRATPALDRELIRLVARTLLGDPGGTRLLRDPGIPPALRRWVTAPGAGDGIEDYADWVRARDAAFGRPRFVTMDLTPQEIYGGTA